MPTNKDNVLDAKTSGDSDNIAPTQVRAFSVAAVLPKSPAVIVSAVKELKAPFTGDHLFWRCAVAGTDVTAPFVPVYDTLIDHGAHMVLICDSLVTEMNLKQRKLPDAIEVETAMPSPGELVVATSLSEYVKLTLYDPVTGWAARTVHTIIAPL